MKREQFDLMIKTNDGAQLESHPGYRVLPGLIVHRGVGTGEEVWWRLSHKSSGVALPGLYFSTRKRAVEIATEHLAGYDWTANKAEIGSDPDIYAAVQSLRRSLL